MGASVYAYWPGITQRQLQAQPDFYNDCHGWGNWMAERESEPRVAQAIHRLQADAILTVSTDGMEDNEVSWVTPQALREAAVNLQQAVERGRPETDVILQVYARNAIGEDDVAHEFVQDLKDIQAIAEWAEQEQASRMTLYVSW